MHDTDHNLLAGFDPNLPLSQAKTIPAAWYSNHAIHDLERRSVFHNSWQLIGRTEQVAAPGQFVTADIAGEPVLVVRDKAGQLRALANVCRHRAARIEPRPEGQASRFRCRYHGWAYDLGGRLAGTPDFDGVEHFCKEDVTLPQYRVDTWGPFVFVHLGTPQQTLAELMAPVSTRSGHKSIDKLKFGGRRVYEMQCNWKIFCDNYLDGGYHIPTLHPDLAKVVNMDEYHTILDGMTSIQVSPLKPSRGAGQDTTLNTVRTGDAAHYWWVYPNFMINIYESTMDTNVVLPLGTDKCLCIFDFYFSDVTSPEAKAYMEQSMAVAHKVQLEDEDICAEVQRGLSTKHYETGRFSVRREAGGYHFHQLLGKALNQGAL